MRFKRLDLNLVVAFDALLDERSVSRAAERLNLTQPALSAALSRLREYFGDDLLVPIGRRMIPTPLAEELRPLAKQMLHCATLFIDTSDLFDPITSQRRFRIGTSDYIMTVLIGPALQAMETVAPHVQIDVYPTGPGIQERLERGEIDVVIGPEIFMSAGGPNELLFKEQHVVVGWSGNPKLATPLSLDEFLDMGHVGVRIGIERELSFAERHMEVFRDRRQIQVTTTQFSSTPWMLVGTSRIAVLQERLAEAFRKKLPLVVQSLPFDMPTLNEFVQFNATRANDPGIRWLIELLRSLAEVGTLSAES